MNKDNTELVQSRGFTPDSVFSLAKISKNLPPSVFRELVESMCTQQERKWRAMSAPVMPFGKHSGKSLQELYENERGYLRWFLSQESSAEAFPDLYAQIQGLFLLN
jgi:uncharacterized protein (DUF3820 family)